ncbi:uncharacterized protein LOC120142699 isoform X3 [Hibiscus syriacus]|uniref:uncharacterized protein LOC120142699 isoform X3 n=1 Tax=Hibiscus syriacus TaxID=106335 RepID=UPI0019240AE1|nr:uncharacterized protein LOC120142699 isoform X3 [Hibiscus syriacus]
MISVAGRLLSLLLDSGCWILPTIQCGDQLVPFWQIYQVLISTILLKLYVVYGWLLETSWDFQLVLVGVGIDGFLSCKVELAMKAVPILKQHFLTQEQCGKWP